MITSILSLLIFLANGISVLRFYQIKDYLFKRTLAHFYLPSSKKLILNLKEYVFYGLFFCFFILALYQNKYNKVQALFNIFNRIDFLIFLLVLFFVLRINLLKKIYFTPKAIIITFLVFLTNFSLLKFYHNHPLTFFASASWISQFIVFTLSIKIFDFCVKPYLNYLGKKVGKKLKTQNLKIVGFVGSYGKSSTKEILTFLMKNDFKILSLPPRLNHEYAILKFLLKADLNHYEYLLIEFGSYYLGNIAWVTKYVTPNYLFITGVTKQHLFLFGNIENIIKGEGTEGIIWMKEGTVFVNRNHEYFEKLENEIHKLNKNLKIFTYGSLYQNKHRTGQTHYKIDYGYEILEQTLEKTKFKLFTPDQSCEFETNLIFPMQIENLIGSLAFLDNIITSSKKQNKYNELKKFQAKIKNIELPQGFLKLEIKNNFYIFNDSYNANPKGVFESINYFKKLKFDYKLIIFNGLFELGNETKKIYSELAFEFKNFNQIILTSDDYLEIFKKILKNKVLVINSEKELAIFFQNLNYPKVGLWIFNRIPEKLTPALKYTILK